MTFKEAIDKLFESDKIIWEDDETIDEAKVVANKVLDLKNADTLALAIINGGSVEGIEAG